eukprot:gene12615-biopygen3036
MDVDEEDFAGRSHEESGSESDSFGRLGEDLQRLQAMLGDDPGGGDMSAEDTSEDDEEDEMEEERRLEMLKDAIAEMSEELQMQEYVFPAGLPGPDFAHPKFHLWPTAPWPCYNVDGNLELVNKPDDVPSDLRIISWNTGNGIAGDAV